MRIEVTKRMLKEGLLRCLKKKTLSKISVIELCKESGINRATFYHHYGSPSMLMKDIAEDYFLKLKEIYHRHKDVLKTNEEKAVLACLAYLYEKKEEIKVMLSKNSENCISGFGLEIINESLEQNDLFSKSKQGTYEDCFLYAVLTSSAAYGLLRIWLLEDVNRTPQEIVNLLIQAFGNKFFVNQRKYL